MKKIIFLLLGLILSIGIYAQRTSREILHESNITWKKGFSWEIERVTDNNTENVYLFIMFRNDKKRNVRNRACIVFNKPNELLKFTSTLKEFSKMPKGIEKEKGYVLLRSSNNRVYITNDPGSYDVFTSISKKQALDLANTLEQHADLLYSKIIE